jgi:hypothetical protein
MQDRVNVGKTSALLTGSKCNGNKVVIVAVKSITDLIPVLSVRARLPNTTLSSSDYSLRVKK